MMGTRLLLAGWVGLLPAAALADAPNPSFYLVNRANQAINQVYVSPASASGWGRDQLGDNTVDSGGNVPIRLRADGTCVYDLRIVFEDGRAEERRGVNTCAVDNVTFGESGRGGRPPAAPAAHDPSFRVINRGQRDIAELYLRQAGSNPWGQDRLGDDTIGSGESKVVQLAAGQCLWDIRFVLEGGRTLEKRRVNLCDITDLPVP